MSEKNFNAQCTDDLVCPYCGYKDENSYEIASNITNCDTRVVCGDCGKEFWAFAEIRADYYTRKIDKRVDGENIIDSCKTCTNIKFDDEWGYPLCLKSNKKIVIDYSTDISCFCELEKENLED